MIKTALQTDASLSGPRAAIKQLTRGCKGAGCIVPFFNGLGPTALGYLMQGGTKFGGYELCKRTAFAKLREAGELGESIARNFQLPIMLASAACAETVASAALCPLEVLKLRMQTDPHLATLGLRPALLSVIKADGVGPFLEACNQKGVKYRGYPTTCSATTGGMRYGLRDYAQYESAAMAAFLAEWTPKLKGGLQLTMCEDSLDMPPWEARIPISGK